jgi:hypothetical protein
MPGKWIGGNIFRGREVGWPTPDFANIFKCQQVSRILFFIEAKIYICLHSFYKRFTVLPLFLCRFGYTKCK